MKKINGYLVVKFNARELREYEGTALGEYGVIDAELYTGNLDVDRGAMEYDNAGSMEEAVELARGLESELDAEEPEVKVTIVKETDETTEEEEVDAQQMIAGWENVLRGQVASAHYKDVDERTAAHEFRVRVPAVPHNEHDRQPHRAYGRSHIKRQRHRLKAAKGKRSARQYGKDGGRHAGGRLADHGGGAVPGRGYI